MHRLEQAEDLLKKYYGYRAFKPIQQKAIESILNGQDTFVVMPTGGGKSLCYQIPALMLDGLTLVISPLISLMKDQVDQLVRLGIRAACMNSMLDEEQYQQLRAQILQNQIQILYVAPERLRSGDFLSLLRRQNIGLIAVDEAHCVSQWGHDFRPSYHAISQFVRSLPVRPVVAAFTATATAETREDIINRLELQRPNIYRASFNRSNLILAVDRDGNRKERLLEFVKNHRGQSGIIYCNTRKEVDKVWDMLQRAGIPVLRYHGGMEDWERNENQEKFIYEQVDLIVATNAFGMGINKPDVRYVVHYNLPKNIESYYQEIGRAGRDGLPSLCVLFFSYSDVHINRYLLEQSSKSEERLQIELQKLDAMVRYADTRYCLRQHILQYFGEKARDHCQACSNCCEVQLGKPEMQQTEEALLNDLRSLRLMLAIDEGVPSYRILSDETLLELAKKQPVSMIALEQITGMGESRIERYGQDLVNTIIRFQQGENGQR
ncbi:MAG: RecQ family ATP-dependent DNA helicase [Peptococcaceae bacterium]|nr:RecQ family ATP-dependent DNA helicase [Peptococcaceae bacterium]